MPKAKRYTEKRFVMLTPTQARQLERLSHHHEVSVPELIRTALQSNAKAACHHTLVVGFKGEKRLLANC